MVFQKTLQRLCGSLLVVGALGLGSSALANQNLADAMNLLLDQVQGIAGLPKLTLADVSAKDFARLTSRARGARLLLAYLSEKKGSVDADGKLVATALTPDKMVGKEGEELTALLTQYGELNQKVSAAFADLEVQIKTIADTEPAKRDLTAFKASFKVLNTALTEAHNAFKPKPPTP